MGKHDFPESDPIHELQSKILKTAFKQEKFEVPQTSESIETPTKDPQPPEIIEVPTKLYVLTSDDRKISIPIGCRNNMNLEPTKGVIKGLSAETLIDLYDLFFKIDSFTYDLSEIIWYCKEEKTLEWKEKLLAEIEQSYITAAKSFSAKQGYSKAHLDKELTRVRKHAKKEVAQIGKANDLNYKPKGHHWEERENLMINGAHLLYSKNLPELSERKMISNLGIVFAVTDLWADNQNNVNREKLYAERIKNRLRSVKKVIRADKESGDASLYDAVPQKITPKS